MRKRILIAQSWQKRYTNSRRNDLEFVVGNHIFLKVAPMRREVRFQKKEKLRPRLVEYFQVQDRPNDLYRLALPATIVVVHKVIHMSTLASALHTFHMFLNMKHTVSNQDSRKGYEVLLHNKQMVEIKVLQREHQHGRDQGLVEGYEVFFGSSSSSSSFFNGSNFGGFGQRHFQHSVTSRNLKGIGELQLSDLEEI